jgi:hypothetical protein
MTTLPPNEKIDHLVLKTHLFSSLSTDARHEKAFARKLPDCEFRSERVVGNSEVVVG